MPFLNAKKVAAVAPAPKGKAASNVVVDQIPGYGDMAALDACIKQLDALYKTRKEQVKQAVQDRLVNRGLTAKVNPGKMTLKDGAAEGSVSLTRRGSNRPLGESEVALLAELFEVEVAENGGLEIPGITTTREKQPSLLAVNPQYAGDEVLLARIDKTLQGVKGVPEDFIIQQPAIVETIVAETAFDRLFAFPAEVVTQAIDVLGGLVFRPVFRDIMKAWDIVRDLLAGGGTSSEDTKVTLRGMLLASEAALSAPRRRA